MSSPAATAPAHLAAARSARLLFDAELAAGALSRDAVDSAPAARALAPRAVPPLPLRLAEDVGRKLGRFDFERAVAAPLEAARRSLLGDRAAAPPRFLVRVDEFPHYRAWDDPGAYGSAGFRRFHAIMAEAGVPYLIAALPRVSRAPLDPGRDESRPLTDEEAELLRAIAAHGVAIGLHGRDHRTRHASPRRHSELQGLDPATTAELLDDALATLAGYGLGAPEVFVPPFNRFDAAQLPALAQRFAVVGGGPEAIRTLGFHRTPQWRGDTVYLPSYFPFYGHAAEVREPARRAIERGSGLWTPIVLHWGWEADAGWAELERLAALIAPHAVPWSELSAAVERSR
ncbi:MAG: DUF2334 domain-containing protein [Solirubrobacterales bacterium]|nr:DUF2334 domain-containing protein [Solirubrobacterales bacterium]